MDDLSGRRAFITGSSSGLGAETARHLAKAGAAIILHGRNKTKLEGVEAELRNMGVEVASVIGGLDDITSARDVAAQALAVGPIDILVNNAGGLATDKGLTSFFEATPEDYLASYRANMISAVTISQAIVPKMIERDWGRVISIASAIVDNPITMISDYKAAKNALISFANTLAVELRGTKVTSNVISPGFIVTEASRPDVESQAKANGWGESWEEIEKNATREYYPALVPRLGRMADIARAVLFLASSDADFITAAYLRVDGGLALA